LSSANDCFRFCDLTLQDRLNKAAYEISFRHHFNNIIINAAEFPDDFSTAAESDATIVACVGNQVIVRGQENSG
jgi:hypothetical protein